MTTPLKDFADLIRKVFRIFRYFGVVFLGVTVWMILREVWTTFRNIHDGNAFLGWIFLVGVLGLGGWLLGVPIWRFLRMPSVLRAPRMPDEEEDWRVRDVLRRLDYVDRYVARLLRNERLAERHATIREAREEAGSLRDRLAGSDDVEAAKAAVAAFEKEQVEPILAPLDREVDQLIRREAFAGGVATAVSQNGSLDAFLVLWRNANLVSRIANVYYGRPGIRGSWRVLRDVSGAAFIASYLEGFTQWAGGFVHGVLGVVAGPLLDGGVNALATLRVGYLAKGRCRSFRAWTEATRRQALAEAVVAAKSRSKDVMGDIARAVGGTLTGISDRVGDAVKGGLRSVMKRFRREEEDGALS